MFQFTLQYFRIMLFLQKKRDSGGPDGSEDGGGEFDAGALVDGPHQGQHRGPQSRG